MLPDAAAPGRAAAGLPAAGPRAGARAVDDGVRQQGDARLHQRHQEPGADAAGVQADDRGVGAPGVRKGLQHSGIERPRQRQGPDLRARRPHGDRVERGAGHRRPDAAAASPARRCSTGWCTASCAPRWAATATRAISGGAPLGKRLGHFYRGVGLSIYEGYGLTETSAAITVNRIGELEVGTVGKLLPGNSMAVAEDGELLVKGGVVFNGYWRNEKATNEAISRRLVPHRRPRPASTPTASCRSPAARRRSSSPRAARTSPPPCSKMQLRAHPLISQAMAVGDNQAVHRRADRHRPRGVRRVEAAPRQGRRRPRSRTCATTPIWSPRSTWPSRTPISSVACGVDPQVPDPAVRLHRAHR